jgi:hypothetical protein
MLAGLVLTVGAGALVAWGIARARGISSEETPTVGDVIPEQP